MHRSRAAILFLLLMLLFSPAALAAQEASPAAADVPNMGKCLAPKVPVGTPEPVFPPGMAATPEDGAEASPAAGDNAFLLPPMPEPLVGEPASPEDAAEAEAAVYNVIHCVNHGMWLDLGALHTANGRSEDCDSDNLYNFPMCLVNGVPPVTIRSIDNAQVLDDGRLAVDVTYRVGDILTGEQFVFVREGDVLLVDTAPDLQVEPPAGATVIEVELVDYAFEMSATSAPAGDIAFSLTNTGEEIHELALLALPDGVDADDLLAEDAPWDEILFLGGALAIPGEDDVALVLLDMEPGTYTIVCFIPDAEGVPHIAHGMVTEFEVTGP